MIRNMDDTSVLCVYDVNNLTHEEMRDTNYSMKKNIGFYVKVANDVVGVMESSRGPIFFFSNRIYYLAEVDYKLRQTSLNKTTGKFELIIDKRVAENIVYNKPKYTDYDPWSLEKDVDFFQWICQTQESMASKDRFHKYYTI